MKKTRIVLTILALAVLASCQINEFENNKYNPEEGELVFKVANHARTTKSAEMSTENKGVSIPIETELGMSFSLDETVTSLDEVAFAPETKGTPGYTENFHPLYDGFDATVYRSGETKAYEENGRFEIIDEANLIYKRKYPDDLWDKEGLYFFLKATPKEKVVSGISNLTYHPTSSGDYAAGDISFHYDQSSTTTAEAQQDILFTSRPVTSEAEYKKLISRTDGIDVLFHHALTGVKFRVGNDNSGSTKTVITKVEISGLYDNGDCVISPKPENNYTDVSDNYSSGEAVVWDNLTYGGTAYSQQFSNPDYKVSEKEDFDEAAEENKANPDGTVSKTDYEGGDYTFGASWYSAAADNNLNDANGTQTFWFIPQAFKENDKARNVTLKVTFRVKTPDTPNGTEIVHTISDFGSKLASANVEWKAGELRTYTLNPLDVDVEIFDYMNGLQKDGLHVTNTGNVDEYVRMMVIGNWYGWLPDEDPTKDEASILVGYKYKDKDAADAAGGKVDDMVKAWYREDGTFSTGFDNTFTGGKPSGTNKWIQGTGSYFYYPEIIGAGDKLSQSTALFQRYTLQSSWIPTIWIPSADGGRVQALGVHLVMECVIQAISAFDPDGEQYETCWDAWSAATGEDIKAKTSSSGSGNSGNSGESGDSVNS